jgi:hypothetical protein
MSIKIEIELFQQNRLNYNCFRTEKQNRASSYKIESVKY